MTFEEKQELKKHFVGMGMYFGHEIDDISLKLYAEDLDDLSLAEVLQALKDLRLDPKTKRCPLPSIIRERLKPRVTDENQAIDAVGRIVEAISKYGWNNSELAKEHIGELGWEVVKREGGWRSVCELSYDGMGVFKAQAKHQAMAIIAGGRAGILAIPPSIPEEGQAGAIDLAKLLPDFPPEQRPASKVDRK